MEKPTGTYQCRACGRVMDGSNLKESMRGFVTVWSCEDASCGGQADIYAPDKRYDVVVIEIDTRKVISVAGKNLSEAGYYTVDRRLGTVTAALSDEHDAEAVPAGQFKVGDILPSPASLRGH